MLPAVFNGERLKADTAIQAKMFASFLAVNQAYGVNVHHKAT